MESRTRAFVIQKVPYEEKSVLVKALLEDRGKCHFFLSKRTGMPDLCEIELSYRVLPTLKIKPLEWHVLDPLLALRDDWGKLSCALEWSKVLLSLPEGFCDHPSEEKISIYGIFRSFLKELERAGPYNALSVLFYLKILQLEGHLSWHDSPHNPLSETFSQKEIQSLHECFHQKKFSSLQSMQMPSEWIPKIANLFAHFMKR